jgi:hypothetical protein
MRLQHDPRARVIVRLEELSCDQRRCRQALSGTSARLHLAPSTVTNTAWLGAGMRGFETEGARPLPGG